jgi:hypothetical protein
MEFVRFEVSLSFGIVADGFGVCSAKSAIQSIFVINKERNENDTLIEIYRGASKEMDK